MSERRVGALLSLFFFMTFALWLSEAPLLPELYPPRRSVLDTVPLWPLDFWTGLPVTAFLWNRAFLYMLTVPSLVALFAFVLDRRTRLASWLLAGLLLAKLAYLSWDLRYLTGADVVHLTMTALFLSARPRLPCLRVGLVILSLVAVLNRMNPAWLNAELLPESLRGLGPLLLAALLGEAVAPLLWLSRSAGVRRAGVVTWLGLQVCNWAALSVLWPSSLAACGPMLLLGAAVLVPLEGPLQDDFEFGPGSWGPAVVLGGLLAIALWPGPALGWLHVHDLDAARAVRSRVVITRGSSQVEILAEVPRARSWDPSAPVQVKAAALIDDAQEGGPLNEPLRLDGTMVFSPHRFRHAGVGLLADPLFYRSYEAWLKKTFHPDRLEIQVEADGRPVLDYDWSDPAGSPLR